MAKARRTGGEGLFDPENDPAPDVFKVEWNVGRVTVTHFKRIGDRKRCCQITGEITDADRASEHGPEIACLQRLQMPCGYR
jgi:hypothetical protein